MSCQQLNILYSSGCKAAAPILAMHCAAAEQQACMLTVQGASVPSCQGQSFQQIPLSILCRREYFQFSYLNEAVLNSKKNYIFTEFPHGVFPLSELIAGKQALQTLKLLQRILIVCLLLD